MAREQRRLAAIVAADAVGYSRLMGRDESGTLARLREHRRQRFEPALARHGGRLVKLTGDGALAEFPSAVDALVAAIEFQQAMAEFNRGQAEDDVIVFRVGLHLGDLIVDGDDLYGDSVNVAARLEGEAPPGGIVVSRNVHDAVARRLKATFADLGALALKNMDHPVQAFRVEWDPANWSGPAISGPLPAASASLPSADAALALPDKPSIAVLPFQNMSGDAAQDYFADGMVEDIITALSRIGWMFVIARNSSFTYKGKAVDVRQVARELGVRYVLEGSVRKAGDRVRITGQLIDAATGGHVWADRFEGRIADIFELQDDVTARVVAALAPSVRDVEIDRARRKPTDNLTAYDRYLRALYFMHRGGKADSDEALSHVHAALEADPRFALAAGLGGMIHNRRWSHGWAGGEESRSAAMSMVDIAQDRTQDDSEVCLYVAHVLSVFGGEPDRVERLYRRSLEMNPNSAYSLTLWATYCVRSGRCDEAVSSVEQARRLSPREPYRYLHEIVLGMAFALQERLDEAITHLKRTVQDEPTFALAWVALSGVHAHQDQMQEAHEALGELLRLRPDATLTIVAPELRGFIPSKAAANFFIDGLRKAGLAE